jgi:hypothetical protein
MTSESETPSDVWWYLQSVVSTARQGRADLPLSSVWDAAEETAVALLRSGQPTVEARRRLEQLLRADPDFRGALRRYVRERAGTAWPERPPSVAPHAYAQLDLFDPPADNPVKDLAPAAGSERASPGYILGVDEPVADILQACVDLASGRLDKWNRTVLAPWLEHVDTTTLVRARIWADVWLRGVSAAEP